jgi:hypothetical protein
LPLHDTRSGGTIQIPFVWESCVLFLIRHVVTCELL